MVHEGICKGPDISGYQKILVEQIMRTDEEVFILMAPETRGKLGLAEDG